MNLCYLVKLPFYLVNPTCYLGGSDDGGKKYIRSHLKSIVFPYGSLTWWFAVGNRFSPTKELTVFFSRGYAKHRNDYLLGDRLCKCVTNLAENMEKLGMSFV